MKKLAIILFITSSAFAQTQITTTIGANQAASVTRVAVPFPDLASGIDAAQVNQAFFAPLTRDIAASGVFAIAPLPPNVAITADLLKRINAMNLLKLTVATEKDDFVVGARLSDTAGGEIFGKQYRGPAAALTKTAHMIADAMVRAINGKPGIFLSQIAFASNRDGASEIYLMDWDGGNQRRITYHNGLSILPSWSPDNERMVYTSFARGTSDMYIINRRGGGRIRVATGLQLNTSATFSPVSNDIAFVGSINGNPDI